MVKFGIGQSVTRTEDPRFLRGQGCFVDDIAPPDMVFGYVLRSPHAHARLGAMKTSAAKALPGVLAVLTAADLDADGIGALRCMITPETFGGPKGFSPLRPLLAGEVVRHVGDPVALIIGESLAAARDGAELVEIDYAALPAVTATKAAAEPGASKVWDEMDSNIWFTMERGDKAQTEAAFRGAAHVVELDLINNRITANAIEPRASLAAYRSADDHTTLWSSSQGAHRMRPVLAEMIFHKPARCFRVICPDVGGGFGMKGGVFAEDALVVWAAGKLGRPVKWTADRTESLLSDTQARDAVAEAALALDSQGKILGLRVRAIHAIGAYLAPSAAVPAMTGSMIYAGAYNIPAAHVTFSTVYSHTPHVGPYRGAGRPEGIYVIERLIDKAARQLAMDPAEIRRLNFVKPDDMPHQTKLMASYDSGHFAKAMDKCLAMADWDGFAARRAASEKAGRLRGRGLAYFIESAAPFNERMDIQFDETGAVTIRAGTLSHGQGHETTYAQMLTEWLGVPFESIRLVQGDTDSVAFGRGTFGSRSMTIGGAALKQAAERIVEKGRPQAAHILEAAEGDVEFADGAFQVAGTDRSVTLPEVARAAYALAGWPPHLEVGLEAAGSYSPVGANYPNGCHICEVELDAETGAVKLVAYTAVDDSGVIINPLLFEGQIHGGLAQGIGQALLEEVGFDDGSGQLLSGSLMDYCMPRAADFPSFNLGEIQVPCLTNPLGVKGAGESGTVGAPPAVIHAILDALAPLGVETIDMPATPERVWRAMQKAKGA